MATSSCSPDLERDAQEQSDEMTALDNILNDPEEGAAEDDSNRSRPFSYRIVAESGGRIGGKMDAFVAAVRDRGAKVVFKLDKGKQR